MDVIKKYIRSFVTALQFLTILPIKFTTRHEERDFSKALFSFPLVGSIIGIISCLILLPLSAVLPDMVCAAIAVALLAAISGFLHFDGLSDSFDGLFSSRDRERSLEIMRDSNVGAMGLAGAIFVMLIKFAAFASVPQQYFFHTLFLVPVAGRTSAVLAMATQKYARKEGGLGQLFYSSKCKKAAALSALFLFSVTVPLTDLLTGIVLLTSVCCLVLLFGCFCTKRIGGATGDTLGATCELTEMLAVVVLVSVLSAS